MFDCRNILGLLREHCELVTQLKKRPWLTTAVLSQMIILLERLTRVPPGWKDELSPYARLNSLIDKGTIRACDMQTCIEAIATLLERDPHALQAIIAAAKQ